MSMGMVRFNNKPLHLQRVGRRLQTGTERFIDTDSDSGQAANGRDSVLAV